MSKILRVVGTCKAHFEMDVKVPEGMSLKEAVKYAKENWGKKFPYPYGEDQLEYESGADIEEFDCEFIGETIYPDD